MFGSAATGSAAWPGTARSRALGTHRAVSRQALPASTELSIADPGSRQANPQASRVTSLSGSTPRTPVPRPTSTPASKSGRAGVVHPARPHYFVPVTKQLPDSESQSHSFLSRAPDRDRSPLVPRPDAHSLEAASRSDPGVDAALARSAAAPLVRGRVGGLSVAGLAVFAITECDWSRALRCCL